VSLGGAHTANSGRACASLYRPCRCLVPRSGVGGRGWIPSGPVPGPRRPLPGLGLERFSKDDADQAEEDRTDPHQDDERQRNFRHQVLSSFDVLCVPPEGARRRTFFRGKRLAALPAQRYLHYNKSSKKVQGFFPHISDKFLFEFPASLCVPGEFVI